MKKVTVIGGGTGSFVVLTGVKKLPNVRLTAIVPATDSGGSTGRLRDEFGYLPVGDVRQCLVALAEDEEESFLLRQLFSYRFEKGGDGLRGHNFGNLLITALTEILDGNEMLAIKKVQKLLNIVGNVYPVTLQKCNLVATYENGSQLTGEHNIDEPPYPHDGHLKITDLKLAEAVKPNPAVITTINNSDLIIIGPGDLYTSLLANLVVPGVAEAIKTSKAKVLYNLNLVSKFGQTSGMSAKAHVDEVAHYLGKVPDYILVNDNELPADILQRYAGENAYPIMDDLGSGKNIIRTNLLSSEEIITPKGDVLKRSLIRHDGERISQVIARIL